MPSKHEHAVLGVDPGETTGIFAGYVNLQETMNDTMETLHNHKAAEVSGSYLEQSIAIAQIMNRFMYTANVEWQIPIFNIHFVFEDFVLRRREEGGATGNLTSCWVAAGAVASFCTAWDRGSNTILETSGLGNPSIKWRQASTAKQYAKNERMKRWGLWQRGSAHQTDAARHFACEVNDLIP